MDKVWKSSLERIASILQYFELTATFNGSFETKINSTQNFGDYRSRNESSPF